MQPITKQYFRALFSMEDFFIQETGDSRYRIDLDIITKRVYFQFIFPENFFPEFLPSYPAFLLLLLRLIKSDKLKQQ